ncbi:TPA: protein kinase domain-containing protein [Serratia fonticola]
MITINKDRLSGRYSIEGQIGEGGMQHVFLAFDHILKRYVALKTPKNKSAEKRFRRSAILAAKVNHPNVAKTFDYFQEDGCEYLIEEFVDGVDLDKAILAKYTHVDPYLTAKIFHNLAKALAASHHVGVIHRDLKPTNVMVIGDINASEVKITDFGISKMAEEEIDEAARYGEESLSSSQTAIGALPYMAPEIIERPKDVSKPTDVWAIGAMMYRIITGNYPFGSGYRAIPNILSGVPLPYPPFMDTNPQFTVLGKQIVKIISLCFQKEPEKRPTADELVKMCGELCYSISERKTGVIQNILYNSYGFINVANENSVFYHQDSVYGTIPKVGDSVIFTKFYGGGSDRAHPVIKLK